MKKLIILALITIVILSSILGYYIYTLYNPKIEDTSAKELALQEKILKSSSWIDITGEDFYGYLNGTYTESVQKIISSLEEAIPIIIKTSNDKFGNFNNYTFIVASAFDTSNQVITYYPNSDLKSYKKTSTSLESLLEDAVSAYIYNETEENR